MDARTKERTRSAALVAATLAAIAPMKAAAGERSWTPALTMTGRPVDRLVAGRDRLFALSGGELVTFDREAQLLGRCAGFAPPPRGVRRAAIGGPDTEEVLAAAGLDDVDDSTPEAEAALEDEGLGPKRRPRAAPDPGVVPNDLATDPLAPDEVWIATSSGLYRGDESGCFPVELDGRDLRLVTAAGGTVLAATEDLLFRSSRDPAAAELANDAAPFTVVAGLGQRPRALAVGPGGTAVVADDDGVVAILGDGASERLLDRPTDALVVCEGDALALADDGVYLWAPGAPPARTADRPPIRQLACGPTSESRFVGVGLGVWTSPDGARWSERSETLGRRVSVAATVGDRTWLASDADLVALDLAASDPTPPPPLSWARAAELAPLAAPPTRRLVAPTLPWPEVTALLGSQRKRDKSGWQVMLLVTFPLGRVRHADPTLVTSERARRDAALAREQLELLTTDDDDGEGRARLESVLQEREALR
jgi:hypothetical protein